MKPYRRDFSKPMGNCQRCGGREHLKDGLCEECRRNVKKHKPRVCAECGYETDKLMHILGHEPGEPLNV